MTEPEAFELQLLLDLAEVERASLDDLNLSPLHLAAVLARSDPRAFSRDFGDEAGFRLGLALANADTRAALAGRMEQILTAAETSDDPARELASSLQPILAELPDIPSSSIGEPAKASSPSDGHRDDRDHGRELDEKVAELVAELGPLAEAATGGSMVWGRDELIDQVVALLGRAAPVPVAIVGPSGSGRTALVRRLAHRLRTASNGRLAGAPVVRIESGAALTGSPLLSVRRLIQAVPTRAILALDDLDDLAGLGSTEADVDLLHTVYGAARGPGHLLVTMTPASRSQLRLHHPRLADLLAPVHLRPLAGPDLERLAQEWRPTFVRDRGVRVSRAILTKAVAPADPADRLEHPGLLFHRLDGATTRAAERGARAVSPADLLSAPSAQRRGIDLDALADRLKKAVRSQDHAVDQLVDRLALTRVGIDIRPERPDAVFLFAGPTGVGKTALTRALSYELTGSHDHLIRLDMTEYGDESAVSRLIGPQPGYVGFTEPDMWLTTRVRECPDAVILLDEIDKAHPRVWNAFLPVFDAGRLTDSQGKLASFADTVVVMTSNMGSEAFDRNNVGFLGGRVSAESIAREVTDTIGKRMSREFVNRLDGTVVFQPLSEHSIRQIAADEIKTLKSRLTSLGYHLTIPKAVVDLVTSEGFDADYGARHLQRNLEELLLVPLARRSPGRFRAVAHDRTIEWESADR